MPQPGPDVSHYVVSTGLSVIVYAEEAALAAKANAMRKTCSVAWKGIEVAAAQFCTLPCPPVMASLTVPSPPRTTTTCVPAATASWLRRVASPGRRGRPRLDAEAAALEQLDHPRHRLMPTAAAAEARVVDDDHRARHL
jgi:hypothetical protein